MEYTKVEGFFCFLLLLLVSIVAQQYSLKCGENNNVDVVETILDSRVLSFKWIGQTKIVYALTDSNNLYRSENDGKTWKSQLPFMQNSQVVQPYPFNRKGIQAIHTSPDDNTIYFLGFNGMLWFTNNGGQTYMFCPAEHPINNILVHPTNPKWLLAEAITEHCYNASKPGECTTLLLVSKENGLPNTWKQIDSYVYQYTWANAGLNQVSPETVWVLDFPEKSGNFFYKSRYDLELRHSENLLISTTSAPVDHIIFMLFHNHNMYLAQEFSPEKLHLLVSEDDGLIFRQAKFPFENVLIEDQYQILDDTEGSVFINVRHGSPYWGNLYSSDALGSNYDLSMSFNSRDPNSGNSQFSRMHGVDGIYLANALQNVDAFGRGDEATYISFDKGGLWMPLALPVDNTGNQVPCTAPNCQLNLHGIRKIGNEGSLDSTFGPLYTNAKSLGLMIGTGNIGQYLVNDLQLTDTYFTRDGGWSWTKIRNGTSIYEFSDYGALMLISPNMFATKTVAYSWDQGLSFVDCKFTDGDAVEVTNIVAEPTSTSQSFVISGYRENSTGSVQGVLIHMNFSGLHERACTFPEDYEEWIPTDSLSPDHPRCLLGVTTTYTRRKRDAKCFNGKEFTPKKSSKPCPCTREDYECDVCYELHSGTCSRISSCDPGPYPPPNCIDYYNVSIGYRFVPGTGCDPFSGVNLLPYKADCPSNGSSTGHNSGGISAGISVLITFIVLFVLLITAVILLYIFRNHPAVDSRLPQWVKNHIPYRRFNDSTAFDETLLEDKDAEPLDDSAIEETLGSKSNKTIPNSSTQDQNMVSW